MNSREPGALVGTVLDGKYAIESYVAKGGFGAVYRGRHLRLRKPVAIKVLHLRDDLPTKTARSIQDEFEEEARLVAGLDHPAIVRVMDSGVVTLPTASEVPWMVTEWVNGDTLANEFKSRRGAGGRSPAECMRLLKPVFEALVCAHEAGVVHRDIKPANLMFTGSATGMTASQLGVVPLKLLDFGIAKVMEPEEGVSSGETATKSTHISFSVKYGAPEQFSGSRTGPWTDVHAMALILTEMLTDRPPYEGREAMDFHLEALSPRRPTPGRFLVDVGPWESVLAKALSLRPAERYATMREFLAALEAEIPIVNRLSLITTQRRDAPEAPSDARSSEAPTAPTFGHRDSIEVVHTGTLEPITNPTAPSASKRTRTIVALTATVAVVLAGVGLAFIPRGDHRDVRGAPPTVPQHAGGGDPGVDVLAPRLESTPPSAAVAADASVANDAGLAVETQGAAPAHTAPAVRKPRHRVPVD